jgi:carboxymethylenebutenolidase
MQSKRNGEEMNQNFLDAYAWLKGNKDCNGKVGVVGFCYGGGISNMMAVRVPDLAAAVPYYGGQPNVADVPKINAPLLLHYASLDTRITNGWPAYEAALKANGKKYQAYIYEGANHGFHNDTTPRYDKAAAELSWQRTIDFFKQNLK